MSVCRCCTRAALAHAPGSELQQLGAGGTGACNPIHCTPTDWQISTGWAAVVTFVLVPTAIILWIVYIVLRGRRSDVGRAKKVS